MMDASDSHTSGNMGDRPGRGRKRIRTSTEDQGICYCTPKTIDTCVDGDKWSVTELTRLLEALKRYEPHNLQNIALLIGTKSEKQIEEKIQLLQQAEGMVGQTERMAGSSGEHAPIEAWLDLVQEMTNYEPADYTQFIPQILGYITRNETFADSGNPKLKWRNIYQFLTDISMNRAVVHQLTDVESMVILDLMHSLGDTLYMSDTTEQRRILDFKYNLLNFKAEKPGKEERELINLRVAQALSNDFWDTEDMPMTFPPTAERSGLVSSEPILPVTVAASSTSSTSEPSSSHQTTSESSLPHQITTESSSPHQTTAESSSSKQTTSVCSQEPFKESTSISSVKKQKTAQLDSSPVKEAEENAQTSQLHREIGTVSNPSQSVSIATDENKKGYCPTHHEIKTDIFKDTSGTNTGKQSWKKTSTKSKASPSMSARERNICIRPKFFTLNPLCVSTQHLPFHPKAQEEPTEGK